MRLERGLFLAGALNWQPIVESFEVGFAGLREFEIVEIVRY